MRKLFFLSAVLVASATACGGGGGSTPPPALPTPAPTVAPTAAPTAAPPQALPQAGGYIPQSGTPQTVGPYTVLIDLASITSGTPVTGYVYYSTAANFVVPNPPPNAPAFTLGTAIVYTDIEVASATGGAATFSSQPGFRFTLPGTPSGTYKLAFYDPTLSAPAYQQIGSAGTLSGSSVSFSHPGIPTTLVQGQFYTYVLYQ